ncbi:MAG: FAD-binding protein [Streptosporangiales bacterium]|nr:FAD-binding protein [Streptosporangiales bacterium]
MMARRQIYWGWGYEDEFPTGAELREGAEAIVRTLGFGSTEVEEPVPPERLDLPKPRIAPASGLAEICSTDVHDRARHSYGMSFRDLVRAFRGQIDNPPDLVAFPRNEREIEAVLEWCESVNAAVIPYGGGTSVVGGVEPRSCERYDGVVSLDLRRLDRVLEFDRTSYAARVQAGAPGPTLERQLAEHGVTLRHFPQSFQFSTLGGWIATRAGGHFATLYTHIDDLVESVRAITPRGTWESRRLPGSGAGPSPDRMLLGSEGTLGVITEAWVRVRDKPGYRASAGVRYGSFDAAAEAVRAIAQAGLYPTNCRLIDATEARLTAGGDGEHALLVLGFESADHPVEPSMDRALELAKRHGGIVDAGEGHRSGLVGSWRDSFIRAPYLRNLFPCVGVLVETFETAITWDRLPEFHAEMMETARDAVRRVFGQGSVTCRFPYVYPDGPAPYYTIHAPARRGEEVEQWDELKRAASDALMAGGGTITHHHAVGRDHRPWYDRQRPEPFAAGLRAAKAALDPKGILNPGVLIDPE